MIRVAAAITLLLAVAMPILAQDVEAPELDHIFNAGTGTLWKADLVGLNAALDGAGYPGLPEEILLFGQTGTYGFADGFRVGYVGLSGSASAFAGERTVRLNHSLGAGVVEWPISSASPYGLSIGVMLGGGFSTLTLVDHEPPSFEDALLVPFRAKLDRWFYVVEPSILTYGDLLPGLTIRLRAGYLFTYGCKWRAEEALTGGSTSHSAGPTIEVSVMLDFETMIDALLEDDEAD